MKKFLIVFAVLSLSLIATTKLKAEVVSGYSLDMKVNPDLSSSIDIQVELQNTTEFTIINAYSIDLPFNVTNANATLNDNPVNILLSQDSGISNLKVDFGGSIIKSGELATLKISAFTLDSVKEVLKTKQLYLPFPSSNYTYSNIDVKVTYPIIFGSISYTSEARYATQPEGTDFYSVNLKQTSPVIIVWGNPELNINFKSIIENRKDATNHVLYNLVPEYANQSVSYRQIFAADYALTDKLNNSFAFVTINPNETINLNSNANVRITRDLPEKIENKYNWNLNLDSVLGQKIYSQINQGSDQLSKLNNLNEFLFSNYSTSSEKISSNNLESVWDNNKTSLNQLEYCYLVVSTAEYLGLNANIQYGYNIFTGTESVEPVVWCNVTLDTENLIFDFSHQKNMGYSQIASSAVDRISMGIWHPSQSYNNILGLLTDNLISAQIQEINPNQINDNVTPELSTDFPENVFSGEFYSGTVFINNPTSRILKFGYLKVNEESVMPNIQVGDLVKAVMPLQRTAIKIDYLRETDFILNHSRDINIQAVLGQNTLSKTITVKFEPDYKLLALFVIILIVIVLILGYMTSKIIKKRHML